MYFLVHIFLTRASGVNLYPVSGLPTFVMNQLVLRIAFHRNCCLKATEYFWLPVQANF